MNRRCIICDEWAEFDGYRRNSICPVCLGKRLITEFQEQALRCCHHDFDCLTLKEAADELNVPIIRITEALDIVKKITTKLRIPLFPILTGLEADCCERFINNYMTHAEIAKELSSYKDYDPVSKYGVTKAIARARAKGLYVPSKKYRNPSGPKMLHYDSAWMDAFIKMQF